MSSIVIVIIAVVALVASQQNYNGIKILKQNKNKNKTTPSIALQILLSNVKETGV